MDKTMQTPPYSVLIVDDIQKNIHLLSDILKDKFQILAANKGSKALAIAQKLTPDLILLDIMMPEMDGYEVCKQLKADKRTAQIPIIFLTALSSTEEEYKGLKLGAADYISKPFNQQVLLTRINTQLELRQAQQELLAQNNKLEHLVDLRTRELSRAHERLKILDAAKQDFLTAISHEIRTPVNGVLGLAEFAFDSLKKHEEVKEYYIAFKESSKRLQQTINNALLLVELQSKGNYPEMKGLSVAMLLETVMGETRIIADDKSVSFNHSEVADEQVMVNYKLIISSFQTLLMAAIRLSQEDSEIKLRGQAKKGRYQLEIQFSGTPMMQEVINTFFDVFSRHRSLTLVEEMGLDIPLSARIIEVLGGSVNIMNIGSEQLQISVELMLFDNETIHPIACGYS